MKSFFAILLAVLLCSGCDEFLPDPFESAGLEAEFRWRAKDMYSSLRMPSCAAPKGFERDAHLKVEYEAVALFEQQALSGAAHDHLQIASADAAFEQSRNDGCWMEYSKLVWAEKHLEMTKEIVRATLPRLQIIAPSIDQGLSDGSAASDDTPKFRYLVRQLVAFTRPLCPLIASAKNEQVNGPALHELAQFRKSLEGSPFALQFDVAQADMTYELSQTVVECADPSESDMKTVRIQRVADVKRQIKAAKNLVSTW